MRPIALSGFTLVRPGDAMRGISRVVCLASFALVVFATRPEAAVAQGTPTVHDDEARGLYLAGEAAFNQGRFEEALTYFQRSYELSPRSALLYNIGQAADRSRRDDIALAAFRGYLEANPDVQDRPAIEGRIRVLEAAVGRGVVAAPVVVGVPPVAPEPVVASEPSPTTTVDPRTPEPRTIPEVVAPPIATPAQSSNDALFIAGGVSLGAGVLGLALGIFANVQGNVRRSDYQTALNMSVCPNLDDDGRVPSTAPQSCRDAESDWRALEPLQYAGFIGGGIVSAVGIVLFVVGATSAPTTDSSSSTRLRCGSFADLGVSCEGSF